MEDEDSASASTSSKASASYEESDAEEEYEREKVLNTEVNKRLLEMGLSPNSLKKHKRQLKEKLIQKQIAFLSQKKKLFPPNGNCKSTAYNSECNPK